MDYYVFMQISSFFEVIVMKKIISVLTAICLVMAFCLPTFAEAVQLSSSDPVLDEVAAIVAKIDTTDEEDKKFTSEDAVAEILEKIKELGVENTEEAIDAADQLYNYGAIDTPEYVALKEAIKNEPELDKEAAKNSIIDQVREIMDDESLDVAGKAAAIGKLLIGLPAEQIQDILDTLLDSGVIDNDMYNRVSDIINNANIDDIGNIFNNGGDALSGLTGLISNLLGMLGLGGGDDNGGSDNGGSSNNNNSSNSGPSNSSNNSSSNSSSSNQVPNTKTGDYALISVAGVAAVACAAFVLTRKKHSDED